MGQTVVVRLNICQRGFVAVLPPRQGCLGPDAVLPASPPGPVSRVNRTFGSIATAPFAGSRTASNRSLRSEADNTAAICVIRAGLRRQSAIFGQTESLSWIDVVEGDLISDPLPSGHDILLAANTVHVLSAAHNVDLPRKLRGQAEQGTQLLLVGLWMDPGHTQPPAAALMSGEFLIISGEGQAYGEDDAEAWLRDTGWRKSERRPLGGPHSVIIAEAI